MPKSLENDLMYDFLLSSLEGIDAMGYEEAPGPQYWIGYEAALEHVLEYLKEILYA